MKTPNFYMLVQQTVDYMNCLSGDISILLAHVFWPRIKVNERTHSKYSLQEPEASYCWEEVDLAHLS